MSILLSVRSKVLLTAALSAALLGSAQSAAYASPAATSASVLADASVSGLEITSAEYAAFLQDKFGFAFSANVTRGEFFSDAVRSLQLAKADKPVTFKDLNASSPYYDAAAALYQNGLLSTDAPNASAPLKAVHAVQLALRLAGLQELASTYPEAKAEQAIAKLPVKLSSLNLQTKQELAAAVDTGVLPASYYNQLQPNAPVTADLANLLIGKALVFKGQYKHYIGNVGDSDIYAKLTDAYNGSVIIKDDQLQKIVDAALEQGLVTGYNLKDSRYEPNFIESLSLVYGHSDLRHAVQLIGLLRSEGIEAKVQFEPKTSAFVYLKEWGEPGVSDQYEVRQIANGNYIEYAKEYDIAFEFANAADKQRFDAIIGAYAKKNKDDQPGLIASSWWQPLYYSLTPLAGYKEITNNKIQLGRYYAQSFSLKEQSKAVVDGFKHVDPAVDVQSYDFWTDVPFYNYLNGESL
ncbi:S-layer homology domain-containing protein [Paenibacillus sacheonensis]|uniref:SLH domain-containing protein n=1 Tax=Paenibacillus sacheonensis TaxID=742054 RepID=A0A7X5BZ95_9BACL|nr:hypothetical protein [Paenibacillus sacheonensis]MBM7566281.1 hypothetical protein [Paenibacillus sacheonensis]NBC70487.1 hypothetical protein [Paenibacillus sacheonensis]